MNAHLHTLARCMLLLALSTGAAACTRDRERDAPAPVYTGDVERLLAERCGSCHSEEDAGADYRVDDYAAVLRCPEGSPTTPATDVGDAGTPLLDVLERPDHADVLSAAEKARLRAWVLAEAPLDDQGVHPPGMLNPRSEQWHGKLASQDRFGPITEANHPEACGRCHAGAPVAPRDAEQPAATAPACTQCHTEPEGVLACGTCHGDGAALAYPPRDRCAFPGSAPDAHAAHVQRSEVLGDALTCTSCHPSADTSLSGEHGNGRVDVRIEHPLAGEDAAFDADTRTCAVGCHDRGGARAQPSFDALGPLGCGDCHGAPPADHFAGACNDCHLGVNAEGSALTDGSAHMNGRVDLKGGRDECTWCHGSGDDPMPQTPPHLLHREPMFTTSIPCTECHVVPTSVTSSGHIDRGNKTPADVRFGERARAREQEPSYEAGTCSEVACHGAGLVDGIERALRWDDRAVQDCAGCHGLPPGLPHPQDTSCASALCHGSAIGAGSSGPTLTPSGLLQHIDGTIDFGGR